MQRRVRVLLVLLLTSATSCATSDLQRRFQQHIDYLADDALEGRGVGSEGIELAAAYIADHFEKVGLEPAGDNGTYFQSFPVTLHRELTSDGRLAFTGDPEERRQGVDYIPFNFSSDDTFDGGLMFCGYGIVDPDRDHDDFAGVDVEGSVVLVLRGEPRSWSDADGQPTRGAMLRNKVYNAKDRGAVAVLVVNSLPLDDGEDRLMEFDTHGSNDYGLPALHIKREMADWVLGAGGMDSLDALQTKLDAGTLSSGMIAHKKATGRAGFLRKRATARNVLGIRRGTGPHADEFVIIGAHYDHLGVKKPMMRTFKAGRVVAQETSAQIHNGADDNASGTSGLIELARMFASAPTDRSLMFIAFSAEESGLLGSKYYVENPTVALDRTAAMLNMDMIGRLARNSSPVQVFGTKCGKEFDEILGPSARAAGLDVAPGVDAGGRSDHAPFVRHEVPSMHFYSGAHTDYHKPSDDSHKINARGGARIVSLVYNVAEDIATRDERPRFQAVKRKKEEPSAAAMTYRVVMGLTPSYSDDGQKGMGVDAVSPDGPADLAGMKAEDRIVSIGGKSVANVYDYMASTRNNKPGDTVDVVIARKGKELTIRVTLAGARPMKVP